MSGKKGIILTEEHKRKIGLANKGKKRTEEFKRRISERCKGKMPKYVPISPYISIPNFKLSENARKRISEALKGNKHGLGHTISQEHKEILRKSVWKGDEVQYRALHSWVQRELGKPDTCGFCGRTGLTGKKIHWANKDGNYKRTLKDWLRLCVPCHKKYDLERIYGQHSNPPRVDKESK